MARVARDLRVPFNSAITDYRFMTRKERERERETRCEKALVDRDWK